MTTLYITIITNTLIIMWCIMTLATNG